MLLMIYIVMWILFVCILLANLYLNLLLFLVCFILFVCIIIFMMNLIWCRLIGLFQKEIYHFFIMLLIFYYVFGGLLESVMMIRLNVLKLAKIFLHQLSDLIFLIFPSSLNYNMFSLIIHFMDYIGLG